MSVLFSVIIPVYQAEAFLEKSVQSVLAQTGNIPFEIILVNDGSKDSSGSICDRLEKEHPGIIKTIHKVNEGPYIARQVGVANSIGEYVLFLDSDDLFVPETFSFLKNKIDKYTPDLIMFGTSYIDEQGALLGKSSFYKSEVVFCGDDITALKISVLNTNTLNGLCLKCIRRAVYPVRHDFEGLRGFINSEDRFDMLGVLDSTQKAVGLPDTLYMYRQNSASTMHNIVLKHYKNVQITEKEADRFLCKWNLNESDIIPLYRMRVQSGLVCLKSLRERVACGLSTKSEYEEAFDYIAKDEIVKTAYGKCHKTINVFYKTGYKLLAGNRKGLFKMWLMTYSALKKLQG